MVLVKDKGPSLSIYASRQWTDVLSTELLQVHNFEDITKAKSKSMSLPVPKKNVIVQFTFLLIMLNLNLVFFAFRAVPEITELIMNWVNKYEPDYDLSPKTVLDTILGNTDLKVNKKMDDLFETKVPHTYMPTVIIAQPLLLLWQRNAKKIILTIQVKKNTITLCCALPT